MQKNLTKIQYVPIIYSGHQGGIIMKVTMDVPGAMPQPGPRAIPQRPVNSGAVQSVPLSSNQTTIQQQNMIVSQLSRERALSDALAIAQMSRSIVQRAIEVSSRLRNIAGQAMNTGRVDMVSLQTAISQIPEGLREMGKGVTIPMEAISSSAGYNPDAVNAGPEIAQLENMSQNMAGGNVPGLPEFDSVQEKLADRGRDIEKLVGVIQNEMKEISGGYGETTAVTPDTVINTGRSITDKPVLALIAQGNLSHETVNRQLGA